MPTFTYNQNINIYYEEYGSGFPILLFAPGGMRSAIEYWKTSPWNPIEALSPHFRVIAMDQRNAGKSTAPINASDGWHSYTQDHLALLEYLEIEHCHLMGGCIGGPYCAGVMKAAPEKVAAAILQQTIGSEHNREVFYEMFDLWANPLRESWAERTPEELLPEIDLVSFRSNMYDGDFMFNVDQSFFKDCETPMLVLMGNDIYHPASTSRAVAATAPNATLIENWKESSEIANTVATAIQFLKQHSPAS